MCTDNGSPVIEGYAETTGSASSSYQQRKYGYANTLEPELIIVLSSYNHISNTKGHQRHSLIVEKASIVHIRI